MKMDLNKNKIDVDNTNVAVTAAIIGVILLALGLAYSTKLYGDLRFDNRVLQKKQDAAATLESNVEAANALTEDYERLQQRGITEQVVFSAVPPELHFSEQATALENIATINGLNLTSVVMDQDSISPIYPNPSEEQGTVNPSLQTFNIQVEVTGAYDDFRAFTSDLVNSIRPYRFKVVEVNGEGGAVNAELTLESVYSPYVTIKPGTETIK